MADIESNIKVNIDTSDALSQLKLLQQQISAFQQGMKNAGAQNAAAAQAMQQNLMSSINATGKFTASIQTIKTSAESFTESLEKNKLSIGQYFKYAGGASKTFGKLFKSEFETIQQVAVDRVKTIQTQYIKLGRDASGAMKAISVRPLALDMDNLGTKTQIAAQKQQLFNQLMKQGSTQLLNFGKNTQWAGRQLMVGFTIPLTLMGQAAAQAYMKIEAASLKFRRVYGDMQTTTEEANKMVKSVQALANEFTKYGIAVADTMEMAASAAAMGKTGTDLMQQVAQASKLAVLGQVEQQQALETTISLTNTFAISTEELAKSVDFLNAVENQTVVSIEDLTIAIPKAAPVVKQLGGDVEDLTFFLTAMKEGGINASEGANALKSGLASLINPTKKASDFLEKFGVNVQGIVEGNKGDIKGTVIDFAKALDTLDPLNRARAIEQMFGKFQFSRLSTLFKNVIDEGSQAATVAGLSRQTAEELAILSEREMNKISDSPMFKFQKSIQDMQAKLAPVGEAFLKAVTPIIEFVTKILDGFNNLSEGTKSFVSMLVLAVAGIGPVLLMTFGLIANGVANIMKLFTNMKSFINKTTRPSDILGEQTSYMNSEQLKSAAIAASLDQSHSKLRQTFTSEAAAVQQLTEAYRNAVQAQQAYSGVPGIQVGNPNATPKKYANGVSMVPGPEGAGDIVPALLSPGEAVIPARSARKYAPVIRGMISGNLPGFEKGTAGVGMRQSIVGPLTEKQTEGLVRTGKTMKEISDEVAAGPYGQTPPTNYGTQISPTTGHSFPAFGVGGVYEKPDGTKVFVKPQMDLVGAMAEMRGTQIARDAHGLVSPEQALRVMMDPTDPENKRKFLVLESALDERLANAPKTFTKDQYFKQLVASLLRGDKDLGVGNLGGDVLADVGTAGVFKTASGKRQLGGQINSMEEQAIINLLGVKGGAKKFFAESTAEIAKSMTPAEYDAAMKAEIQAVMPRLQATIAGFGNLSPEEKKAYMDMQQRLQAGMSVDWSKYQFMHAAVKPKEYSMGTPSVKADEYQSKSQADREKLYKANIGKVNDDDINKYIGLQDTHIVSAISSPAKGGKPREGSITDEQLAMLSQVIGSPIDRTKLEGSGFELLANATARISTKVNQKIKADNAGMDGAAFARAWKMFGGKFSKLSLVSGASRGLTESDLSGAITRLDEGILSATNKKGTIVSDQSLSDIVDSILQSDTNLFAPIIEQRNRIATMRAPLGDAPKIPGVRQSHEQAYELLMSGQGTLTASGGTVASDIFVDDLKNIDNAILNKARIAMTNTDSFEPNKGWWKGNETVKALIQQGINNNRKTPPTPAENDLEAFPDNQIAGLGHYIKHILAKKAREEMLKKSSQDILKKARETQKDVRPQVTLGYSSPTVDVYKEISEKLQEHGIVLPGKEQEDGDEESAAESNPHKTFVEKEILKRIERGSKVLGDFPFRDRGIAPGGLSIAKEILKGEDGKPLKDKDGKPMAIPAQPTYDAKSVKAGGNVVRIVDSGMGAVEDYKFLRENLLFAGTKPKDSLANADKFFEGVVRYAKGGIVPGGTGKPKASVFDVDDTLLDLASFMPAHQERNAKLPKEQRLNWWEEVAKDPKGIPAAIQRLKEAQMRGNKILLMTARPKSYDEVTIDTLRKLGIDMNGVKLISRESKDYRKPEQMKYDKTSKYSQWYDIEEFYDDLAKTRGAVGLMGINAIDPLKLAMGSVKVPGYADGVFSVPGPKGAGDVVPAMLSPGEAVIPARQAAKHRPMIKQMIAGNLPGYAMGGIIPGYEDGIGSVPFGVPVKVIIVGDETSQPNLPILQEQAADKQIEAQEQSLVTDKEQRETLKKQQELLKAQTRREQAQQLRINAGYDEMSPEKQARFDEELQKKYRKEDRKPSILNKAFQRSQMTGKAQMGLYGATSVLGVASTMGGGIGQAAQAAMAPIGAAATAMSMIPGPAGMVVAALAAIGTTAFMVKDHLDKVRAESLRLTEAMGSGNDAINKFAVFAKTVSATETMNKRRDLNSTGFFNIVAGKKTFGESYMESDAGKQLVKDVSTSISQGGLDEAKQLITTQLSTAIAAGVLNPAQARSIAANLGVQLKDANFGIQINGRLTDIFGPNGENLKNEPLQVRMRIIEEGKNQFTSIVNSDIADQGKVRDLARSQASDVMGGFGEQWVGEVTLGISDLIGLSIEQVKYYENIDKAAGSISGTISNQLELQQQMVDSLDIAYEKRIAELDAAEDKEEIDRLILQHETDRQALITANAASNLQMYKDLSAMEGDVLSGTKTASENALDTAFKDGPRALEATMAKETVKNLGPGSTDAQKIMLNNMLATGQVDLSQRDALGELGSTEAGNVTMRQLMFKGGPTMQRALSLAGNFEGQEKTDFLVNIATADPAATEETLSNIEHFRKLTGVFTDPNDKVVVDAMMSFAVDVKNADIINDIKDNFDELGREKTIDLNVVERVNGKPVKDAIIAGGYEKQFDKLDKTGKARFTTEMETLLAMKGDPAVVSAFNAWAVLPENVGKSMEHYFAFQADRIVTLGVDLEVAPGEEEEDAADDSGPAASWLDQYVKDVRDASKGSQALTTGITASGNALKNFGKSSGQLFGLFTQLKKAGASSNIIESALGGDEETTKALIDTKTGKLKAGAQQIFDGINKVVAAQKKIDWLRLGEYEKLGKYNEMYNANLDVIKLTEDKINKKYDARIKALDTINSLNEKNAQQQQSTLTLASALSKGDIAAAAQAAIEKKKQDTQLAIEDQKKVLQSARETELKGVVEKVNGVLLTREQIEQRILTNTSRITRNKATELETMIRIGEQAERIYGSSNSNPTVQTKARGGMIMPQRFAFGGGVFGTDTVPAMLTPGEFVIRKSAVDAIGVSSLNALNSGASVGESVYNYSITVNANSSDASGIADAVLREVQRIDSRRIRSSAI